MLFEQTLFAGWGDMDFNSHMRNTAYLDKSADARMLFFAEHGFPIAEFARERFGPVIQRDELDYFKEVGLLESVRVTLASAGLAEDGSRFRLRNEFFRADGKLAARVTSTGGWLDLDARRLVAPPPALRDLLAALPKTDDYQAMPAIAK
jgi:acyl-CoA thioester hydrolase